MQKPIYSSSQHRYIMEPYVNLCKEFVKEVATKNKYQSYLEVVDTIMQYSNSYGQEGIREKNFYDWIMIIPTNLSVATNGFFAAIETKKNSASVRGYKIVLQEVLLEAVDKLDKLETTYD
tara:strand:+ start:1976 stop:2335 length:360 start_codon:yes stop_codon:yes gene_type:complete